MYVNFCQSQRRWFKKNTSPCFSDRLLCPRFFPMKLQDPKVLISSGSQFAFFFACPWGLITFSFTIFLFYSKTRTLWSLRSYLLISAYNDYNHITKLLRNWGNMTVYGNQRIPNIQDKRKNNCLLHVVELSCGSPRLDCVYCYIVSQGPTIDR